MSALHHAADWNAKPRLRKSSCGSGGCSVTGGGRKGCHSVASGGGGYGGGGSEGGNGGSVGGRGGGVSSNGTDGDAREGKGLSCFAHVAALAKLLMTRGNCHGTVSELSRNTSEGCAHRCHSYASAPKAAQRAFGRARASLARVRVRARRQLSEPKRERAKTRARARTCCLCILADGSTARCCLSESLSSRAHVSRGTRLSIGGSWKKSPHAITCGVCQRRVRGRRADTAHVSCALCVREEESSDRLALCASTCVRTHACACWRA
eukprot:4086460-Pleurochrysis_carterae.AAC.2